MEKDKKTFANRAKDIMRLESDPKLQNQLLEKLAEEQEAYKEANGLNEKPQQQEQQMQSPQFYGGGFSSWWGDRGNRQINRQINRDMNKDLDMEYNNIVGNKSGMDWGNAGAIGMQMLPSVVSGAANYFSNQKLARKAGNYGKDSFNALKDLKSTAYLQDANYINLEQQRSSAVKRATDAKNTMNRTIKSGSKTRGEYMSNSIAGTVGIQRNLDDVIGQSRMQEAQYNQAEKSRIGSANAQTMNNNQNTNNQYMMAALQSRDNWNQQALAYKQGQYGAPVSMMGDINKIMMQNQMIRSMGNHYGYEQGDWRNANMWNDVYKGRTT